MDKITKNLIRILKDNDIYHLIPRNKLMLTYINTININGFLRDLYRLYNIDIFKLINLRTQKPICKDIIITDINDYNIFSNFLKENGIIWCTNKVFNDKDIEHYTNLKLRGTKIYFCLDITDRCKISYGEYVNVSDINKINERLVLKENDFYEYYKSFRKKINNNLLILY